MLEEKTWWVCLTWARQHEHLKYINFFFFFKKMTVLSCILDVQSREHHRSLLYGEKSWHVFLKKRFLYDWRKTEKGWVHTWTTPLRLLLICESDTNTRRLCWSALWVSALVLQHDLMHVYLSSRDIRLKNKQTWCFYVAFWRYTATFSAVCHEMCLKHRV